MAVQKVCPVIIRDNGGFRQILVFRHPSAGVQLVKGTVEPDEQLAAAALRELAEESGITSIHSIKSKGSWFVQRSQQEWHFFLCSTEEELKDQWDFFPLDGGGLVYSFFWFDLDKEPDDKWHPVFKEALVKIKSFI